MTSVEPPCYTPLRDAHISPWLPLARMLAHMIVPPSGIVPSSFAADRSKWEQIADVLRQRIADGTYAPGARVPSVVAITAEFDVAGVTARKALASLREDGLIYTVNGLGSFVSAPEND